MLNRSRSSRTLSGRPIRTTLSPALESPSTRLSTATFESDVASTGPIPACTHCLMRVMLVCVLPVPGGPWIRVIRRERPARKAACCEAFSREASGTGRCIAIWAPAACCAVGPPQSAAADAGWPSGAAPQVIAARIHGSSERPLALPWPCPPCPAAAATMAAFAAASGELSAIMLIAASWRL